MAEEKIIHTMGLGNCGGKCVIHVHMKDGKIERLTTETAEDCPGQVPLTACMKGLRYHETFLAENRLRWPMKRVGRRGEGKFVRISWAEAMDEIVRQWTRIRDAYGPGSRFICIGSGICGSISDFMLLMRLLTLDGGYLGSYNSYSTACTRKVTPLMYGTNATGNDPADWLNSSLILLWGHNPLETKFGSETMYYLREAKKKGIPIISVDPRLTDTAKALGAEWVPVRPATDPALMDAMAWVIYTEGLHDQAFLDRCCLGFDGAHLPEGVPETESVLAWLLGEKDGVPKTPEWAEPICGVPAETIRSLARRYAAAKPAALIEGYGAQRNANGEQVVRGGILLACMTGNVGVSGGWAAGTGDCKTHAFPYLLPDRPNPYPYQIPSYRWTEAVERGHEMGVLEGVRLGDGSFPEPGARLSSDIKMIFNLAGGCMLNQHGDVNHTAALLQDESKVEFILCGDIFLTPTAKFADILLPGVSMFETENITPPWSYGNFIGFCNKVMEPLYECRDNYDWISELAERLGYGPAFTEGLTAEGWLRRLYGGLREKYPELPEYDEFREAGIYRYKENPYIIAFEQEAKDPVAHPFPTPSGKIELFTPFVYENEDKFPTYFPPIPRYLEPPEGPQDPLAEKYPLQLVAWHTKRRTHSTHETNAALRAAEPQVLWMHPRDAEARGLTDGAEVLVWNDRGRMKLPLKITERVMPGVTALSQGAWYTPDAGGTDLAGSINVLTSLATTPYAHGNPQHTNLVEVRAGE